MNDCSFVNLTTLTIILPDGQRLPPAKTLATVIDTKTTLANLPTEINEIPVYIKREIGFSRVMNLPAAMPGNFFIVHPMVAMVAKRDDIVTWGINGHWIDDTDVHIKEFTMY